MKRAVDIVIYREGEHWVAQAVQADVSSFGTSREEARAMLREALEPHFERVPGETSPPLREAWVETLTIRSRVPASLRRKLSVRTRPSSRASDPNCR